MGQSQREGTRADAGRKQAFSGLVDEVGDQVPDGHDARAALLRVDADERLELDLGGWFVGWSWGCYGEWVE